MVSLEQTSVSSLGLGDQSFPPATSQDLIVLLSGTLLNLCHTSFPISLQVVFCFKFLPPSSFPYS